MLSRKAECVQPRAQRNWAIDEIKRCIRANSSSGVELKLPPLYAYTSETAGEAEDTANLLLSWCDLRADRSQV